MSEAQTPSILVCLDESPSGEIALGYAILIAKATGASLLLLDVVDPGLRKRPRLVDALGAELARAAASRYLAEVAGRLSDEGLLVRVETPQGRAAEQILEVAERERVQLVVVASHGEPGATHFRLGGTAQRVIQHSHRSVLLVRSTGGPEPVAPAIQRLLVPLDGSAAAEAALPRAAEVARSLDSEVVLAHATVHPVLPTCEPPTRGDSHLLQMLERRNCELAHSYLRTVERGLRVEGVRCRSVTTDCDSAYDGILRIAEREHADLIVVASHGHTSSERVVHGAVTQQLLVYSARPLWVVQNVHTTLEVGGARGRAHGQALGDGPFVSAAGPGVS